MCNDSLVSLAKVCLDNFFWLSLPNLFGLKIGKDLFLIQCRTVFLTFCPIAYGLLKFYLEKACNF